jgi:hypothetical protein
MKLTLSALPLLLASTLALAAPPRTLRVDYFHTGTAAAETFSLDRTVVEPLPWPGAPDKALDTSNLGKYFFEVVDRATNKVLYSRGFCSIYGEWETTGEARTAPRTFSESLRFPRPDGPVQISVKKRDAANAFREVWSFGLDPADPAVDPSLPPSPGELIAIQKSGDPKDKVDFLIMGDGYTREERPKFEKEARRLTELLFAQSPYKEHRSDFNVWALCPVSEKSGISRPSTGVHLRTPLGTGYDAFGSERYVLTFENRTLRDLASYAPYEFLEILVNGETYGGAGIFGQFSTVAASNLYAPYVFVHEFGHHFAGLADEYYTSDVAYETGKERPEPWEANASADGASPKWKALVQAGTPLPTPWQKQPFEEASLKIQARRHALRAANRPETEMNALFEEEKAAETKLLGSDAHSGKVGAFEGCNYEAKGYFRAQEDCIMFTRDNVPFCAACKGAIEKVIALYSGK